MDTYRFDPDITTAVLVFNHDGSTQIIHADETPLADVITTARNFIAAYDARSN